MGVTAGGQRKFFGGWLWSGCVMSAAIEDMARTMLSFNLCAFACHVLDKCACVCAVCVCGCAVCEGLSREFFIDI